MSSTFTGRQSPADLFACCLSESGSGDQLFECGVCGPLFCCRVVCWFLQMASMIFSWSVASSLRLRDSDFGGDFHRVVFSPTGQVDLRHRGLLNRNHPVGEGCVQDGPCRTRFDSPCCGGSPRAEPLPVVRSQTCHFHCHGHFQPPGLSGRYSQTGRRIHLSLHFLQSRTALD